MNLSTVRAELVEAPSSLEQHFDKLSANGIGHE